MAQTQKFQRSLKKLEKAFNKYQEIVKAQQLFSFLSEELIVEIATKRFEYTYEILWKTLKERLRLEGVECSTPLGCFKEAFKAGLIDERHEALLPEIVDKRNEMVHVYDEERAKEIYLFIKDEKVFSALESICQKLNESPA